jgi:hypothetical protein
MPARPKRRSPKPDRRRALELLASCSQGCTESLMLAHGFTIAQMSSLCAQPRRHCKQVRQRSRSKPLKRGASRPPNQGLAVDRAEAAMAAFAKSWRPE